MKPLVVMNGTVLVGLPAQRKAIYLQLRGGV
jgi:hypothetical protein